MSVVVTAPHLIAKRVAWAALAAFLLAFIVLEVINHGGPALIAALLLLMAPGLTMFMGGHWHNLVHRPWIPLAVLVVYSVGGLGDWVPLFTAGLGWLAHIAVERAFGHGLRERRA